MFNLNSRHMHLMAGAIAGAFGLATVGLGASGAAAGSDGKAGAQGATTCRATYKLVIRPGISATPAPGSNHTEGAVPISCDGPVLGSKVTGPGRLVGIGHQNASTSCLGGDGWGTFHLEFPTAKGTRTVLNPFVAKYGGLTEGLSRGTLTGDYFDGSFEATPIKGDCALTPITLATLELELTPHTYRAPS